MKLPPLWFPFTLSTLATLFSTVFFPGLRLVFFAPFLAIAYNRTSLLSSLWISSLCGLLIDLLSSEVRLGLYALSLCLTTLILYSQKRHFFEEKPTALSLFTALISIVSTLLQLILMYAMDQEITLTGKFLITDLMIMPCIDALYAYLWFFFPMKLYAAIEAVGFKAVYRSTLDTLKAILPPLKKIKSE